MAGTRRISFWARARHVDLCARRVRETSDHDVNEPCASGPRDPVRLDAWCAHSM